MPCPKQRRRSLLLTALATGACPAVSSTAAEEDQPGSDERPQKGDLLVLSEGDHDCDVIRPSDLTLSGPPVHAWPKDPKTSVIRKGSRLNEILVIKLDPGELDEETRSRSADGIGRIFGDLHSHRMSRLEVGDGRRTRQERSQTSSSQL
jgi:rieske iron-sulfur protein